MPKFTMVLLITLSMLITATHSWAGLTPCTGKLINPITDICWECLFPATVGDHTVVVGHEPDTKNPSSPICECSGNPLPKVGMALGYWEPMALIEVTRSPYCLVSLGGVKIANSMHDGSIAVDSANQDTSFFHVHVYNFPLMQMLGLLSSHCRQGGSFSLIYMSELDPTWNDDILSQTLFPETSQFGSLPAQLACGEDAMQASVGLPNDNLFWCAGAQGSMYPITGHIQEHIGGIQASVLVIERVMFKLHLLGMVQDSSAKHLCGEEFTPVMPKSRYRYQLVYPKATTGQHGCQPFGRTTMFWGAGLELPTSAENYVYVVWRKKNCCEF